MSASAKGHRSLLGELFGFVGHSLEVLLILVVVAIFARDFSIDFHTMLREGRSQGSGESGRESKATR